MIEEQILIINNVSGINVVFGARGLRFDSRSSHFIFYLKTFLTNFDDIMNDGSIRS